MRISQIHGIDGTVTKQSDDELTSYDLQREEARMQVIDESMERALGRGKLKMNPPKQMNDYDPHDWGKT